MKILLIYNAHAGNGRARRLLPQVESALIEYNIDFELEITNYPGHGVEIVKNANFNNFDGIVAAGGDGTLFEVINGYFQNKTGKIVPIGVLPVGTGNAFARDLNLDYTQIKEAIQIIANQKTRAIDVGKMTTHGQVYYFLNILGIGFVTDVTKSAHKLKLFGNLSYTLGVLYHTVFLKTDKMVFEIDGNHSIKECTFVEVSNTRYTANFLMAPTAIVDDGLLDVTIVKKISRLRLLQSFPKIFTGKHVEMKEVETYKAKQIKMNSFKTKTLSPDGELLGTTPVDIICLKQAVEMYWK